MAAGMILLKKYQHKDGRSTWCIVVVRETGGILKDCWNTPCGGKTPGSKESHFETAMRETEEEVQLKRGSLTIKSPQQSRNDKATPRRWIERFKDEMKSKDRNVQRYFPKVTLKKEDYNVFFYLGRAGNSLSRKEFRESNETSAMTFLPVDNVKHAIKMMERSPYALVFPVAEVGSGRRPGAQVNVHRITLNTLKTAFEQLDINRYTL